MRHFGNIGKMCDLLLLISKELPGEAGREVFKRQVQEQFEFTPQQAEVYVATLLSRNSESSPDNAKTNAYALLGAWKRGEQTGNPLGWMKTVTETWDFRDDLSYEHKIESYAGAVTSGPFFQSSYSSPSSNVDRGIWAPSDVVLPEGVDVAIISLTAAPKRLRCRWAGPNGRVQTKLSIYGSIFTWE
jgi:beta-lactamase class A